ncbi:Cytokinesis protein sepH [Pelomyxa schiedti]|nr:Cytokinesis protein sepH [Pelomyxa schiedti]
MASGGGGATSILTTSFGTFIIGEKIGKGNYASVFKAQNASTGEVVAAKRIETKGIPKASLASFHNEIKLLSVLKHDNIVRILGSWECPPHVYIFLEYAQNGSLLKLLKELNHLPEHSIAVYVAQILKALAYLHEKGVIHRDIKAANVLLSNQGKVLLSDFGVAALEDGGKHYTVVGSPFWMAPEVITESGHNTLSDIWSLGCTIVELLTGEPPYFKFNAMSAMFKIVQSPMPIPNASQPLQNFLMCCFQKTPTDRPPAAILLEHPWLQDVVGNGATPPQPTASRDDVTPPSPAPATTVATTVGSTLSTEVLPSTSMDEPPNTTPPSLSLSGGSKNGANGDYNLSSAYAPTSDPIPADAQSRRKHRHYHHHQHTTAASAPNVLDIFNQSPQLPMKPSTPPYPPKSSPEIRETDSSVEPRQRALRPQFIRELTPTTLQTNPPIPICCVAAVGSSVWVGGSGGMLSIWKADELKSLTQLQLHHTDINALLHQKRVVWAGSSDSSVYIIDINTFKFRRVVAHDPGFRVVSRFCAVETSHTRVWSCASNPSPGCQISILSTHGSIKHKVNIQWDVLSMEQFGKSIWLASSAGIAKLNPDTAKVEAPPPTTPVRKTALLSVGDQYWVAGGSFITIYDISGTEIKTLKHDPSVTIEQLSPALNLVIACDSTGNMHVWDPLTMTCLRVLHVDGCNMGLGKRTVAVPVHNSASIWAGTSQASVCVWQPPPGMV